MTAAPALDGMSLAPARAEPGAGSRSALRAVLRRLALNLTISCVVPTGLFYICLIIVGIWPALIVALLWCYGIVGWRLRTRRPTSVLLWLTVAGLTGKTIMAFATGSTFIYFVQPAVSDAVFAAAFLMSLTTSRSAVARLAGEFYPMTGEIAARPRVQALFTRLTLLWAGICAAKAGVTLWLLHTLSVTGFVAAKTVLAPSVAVAGTAVTVAFAVRVARREGLLPIPAVAQTAGAGT